MVIQNANLAYTVIVTKYKGKRQQTLFNKDFMETNKELPFKTASDLTRAASVGRSMGQTINIGNFQSVRVDVTVTVPCDIDSLDSADQYALDWVNERVTKDVKEITDNFKAG